MKKGSLLIRSGLLLIGASVALGGYNLYDGYRAGRVAQETMAYLETRILPHYAMNVSSQALSPENTGTGAALQQELPVIVDTPIDVPLEMPLDTPLVTPPPVGTDAPAEVEIPDYVLNPNMPMPVSHHNGQEYIGILEIPALDLRIPVISEWSYPRLRIAPCRYAGSAYTNNLVISAHNYASHFGSLSRLYEGAAVIFTDADGNVFNYRVGGKETLNPKDVEYMTDSGWDLTLFTCTPGGSYRVTVRCTLVKAQPFVNG